MKTLEKEKIENDIQYYKLVIDRELLENLRSPYLVKLEQAIQTKDQFFLISEFLENGSLEDFLIVHENVIKFFAAEIINIIEFLHSKGMVHGNLSTSNIFIGSNRHLKLADFGKALIFNETKLNPQIFLKIQEIKQLEKNCEGILKYQIPFSILQYCSPEFIKNSQLTPYSDLWSLGCIIYRMFVGKSPFHNYQQNILIQNILNGEYQMPIKIPNEAQSLIKQLLILNSEQRIGAINFNELKNHPYFQIIDWNNLNSIRAPYRISQPFEFNQNYNISQEYIIKEEPKIIIEYQKQEENIVIQEQPVQAKVVEETQIANFTESSIEIQTQTDEKDDDISPIITESQIQREHGEQQLLKSIVLKKCGWVFYQPRLMILYDSKIIRYFHPSKTNLKGEIPITKNIKVEKTKKDAWQITTPQRIYYFQDYEKSIKAEQWVTKINEIISQLQ